MRWNLLQFQNIINQLDWTEQITPSKDQVLRVFEMRPDQVKVVIVGQDPYPKLNVANGLAFAVQKNTKIPASLMNLFKEIYQTYNIVHTNRTLASWTQQGVFLVNKNLTTRIGISNYHDNLWKNLVIQKVAALANFNSRIVWVLWGKSAQKIKRYLPEKTIIVEDAHPSPLSFRLRKGDSFQKIDQFVKINW